MVADRPLGLCDWCFNFKLNCYIPIYTWIQIWGPTWAVSYFVAALTALFTLRCGDSSLEGLRDFSEEMSCGFFLHGRFPVVYHFVCDFDSICSLLGFLWTFCSIFIVIIFFVPRAGLLQTCKKAAWGSPNFQKNSHQKVSSPLTSSLDGSLWYPLSSSSSELSVSSKFKSAWSFSCRNL